MPEMPDLSRPTRIVNADETADGGFDRSADGAQAMERWPLLKSMHDAKRDQSDGAAWHRKLAAPAPADSPLTRPEARPQPAAEAREPLPVPVHQPRPLDKASAPLPPATGAAGPAPGPASVALGPLFRRLAAVKDDGVAGAEAPSATQGQVPGQAVKDLFARLR